MAAVPERREALPDAGTANDRWRRDRLVRGARTDGRKQASAAAPAFTTCISGAVSIACALNCMWRSEAMTSVRRARMAVSAGVMRLSILIGP